MSGLNVARLTNKLRSLFVLRGGPPPVPEVSDELVPVMLMEGERPEHYYLAGEILWHGGIFQNGLAAERAWVEVRNPVGSGLLVEIEDFSLDNATNTMHSFGVIPPGLLPLVAEQTVNVFPRDSRWNPAVATTVPGVLIASGTEPVNPAAQTGWFFNPQQPGTRPTLYKTLAILHPGAFYRVVNDGIASGLRIAFFGKVRPLETPEEPARSA